MASAYSTLGKWKEAQKIFEFIVSEDPKHVSALNNLGYVYFSFGEIAKAENKDMYTSIDTLMDKLDRQILKFKGKASQH